jgi:class III poly(R)-hydroxyalkanoic acid synthase PhaE subunit
MSGNISARDEMIFQNGTDKMLNTSFTDWNKMMKDVWEPLQNQWSDLFKATESQESMQFKGRVGEYFQTNARMWQTMLGAMSGPEAMEHFQKATQITPDIALGFAQTCLQSFTSLQTQVGEWIQKRGASLSAADIQELDREFIKKWRDVYENEFSRYLKIPQVGLGRVYQERLLQATDKLNAFQATLSEFLLTLAEPIEKSLTSLQEKMAEMTAAGPLDEKSKTYYNLWIKLLEGHYMELFKAPDYSVAMVKTLGALNEFVEARQTVVNDLLRQFNIPTHQDLDELAKEIYLLKKRMRAYEKREK